MAFPQNMFNNLQEFLNSLSDIDAKQIRYELNPTCIIIFLKKNNNVNKILKEEQIRNFMFTFNNIMNSEEVYFNASCLTNKQFYNDIFVLTLNELIQSCPAIDKVKVSEMVQENMQKQKKFKYTNSDIIEEGISDWWQRKKDQMKSDQIDNDYEKVVRAKEKERNKNKNDSIMSMINNIESVLEEEGYSWANLYKVLHKMGLKNESILKTFISLFDENGKAPGYKVISNIASNLVNKANNINLNDNETENVEGKLKDTLDYIQSHYDFSDDAIYKIIGTLNSSDFENKNNTPEKLLNIAFKKAGLSQNTIDRYKKEEEDLESQLNREFDNKQKQSNNNDSKPDSVQNKLKDLVSALRNQGFTQKQAVELCKTIDAKDLKSKSIEDLYVIAMKKHAQNKF